MGRRQAWPGQVLGKSAIELSKKKDYSKGILLRGTNQTKTSLAGSATLEDTSSKLS